SFPVRAGRREVFGHAARGVLRLQAFLVSTGVVALGEMGDKTQLLAIVLAATFRKPLPIVLGILVSTLANHAAAGALGGWVTHALGPDVLRWIVCLAFLAIAAWMLVPVKLGIGYAHDKRRRLVVLGTNVDALFVYELDC